jgi:hypothetical protein
LVLVKDSIQKHETVASKKAQGTADWDPDWLAYTFTCWLKCSLNSCGEMVAVMGRGGIEPEFDPDEGHEQMVPYYKPLYAWPMPDMFEISKDCPDIIRAALRTSFRLAWSDSAAAAGRLRVALECMLSSLGIKDRKRVPGKIVGRTLHERLEVLKKTHAEIAGNLMAVKWFGNTGSHETATVSFQDLMTAYTIVEHAMDDLISERAKRVKLAAKALTISTVVERNKLPLLVRRTL